MRVYAETRHNKPCTVRDTDRSVCVEEKIRQKNKKKRKPYKEMKGKSRQNTSRRKAVKGEKRKKRQEERSLTDKEEEYGREKRLGRRRRKRAGIIACAG